MNNITNGKQCKILCHVDSLKISYVEPDSVSDILKDVNNQYRHIVPVTVTCGRIHGYLGVRIYFSSPGKAKFPMVDYIRKMLDALTENMMGESATPSVHHLFDVVDELTRSSKEYAKKIHHFVARLIYLSNRAGPDIHIDVSLLCTHVQQYDTNDHKKLSKVMKYIQGTI